MPPLVVAAAATFRGATAGGSGRSGVRPAADGGRAGGGGGGIRRRAGWPGRPSEAPPSPLPSNCRHHCCGWAPKDPQRRGKSAVATVTAAVGGLEEEGGKFPIGERDIRGATPAGVARTGRHKNLGTARRGARMAAAAAVGAAAAVAASAMVAVAAAAVVMVAATAAAASTVPRRCPTTTAAAAAAEAAAAVVALRGGGAPRPGPPFRGAPLTHIGPPTV